MTGRFAKRFNRSLVASVISSLLACVLPAAAQDQMAESWAGLAREADLIALGECASEHAAWSDDNFIATTVQFRLHRIFKGDVTPVVTVKTLGGTLGDETVTASHGATLAAGEPVLLFLKRSQFGSYYVIVGGEEGKVTVNEVPTEWSGAPTAGTTAELARLLSRGTGGR
jgi:hypothetical protein